MTELTGNNNNSMFAQFGNNATNMNYNPTHIDNYRYDQETLDTQSLYHQFTDFKGRRVIARYTKGNIHMVSFFREHPLNRRQRLACILRTNDNEAWHPYTAYHAANNVEPSDVQLWQYNSDVIELYEGVDSIEQFERWNAQLLADGTLVNMEDGESYYYDNRTGMLLSKSAVSSVVSTRKPATMKKGR